MSYTRLQRVRLRTNPHVRKGDQALVSGACSASNLKKHNCRNDLLKILANDIYIAFKFSVFRSDSLCTVPKGCVGERGVLGARG